MLLPYFAVTLLLSTIHFFPELFDLVFILRKIGRRTSESNLIHARCYVVPTSVHYPMSSQRMSNFDLSEVLNRQGMQIQDRLTCEQLSLIKPLASTDGTSFTESAKFVLPNLSLTRRLARLQTGNFWTGDMVESDLAQMLQHPRGCTQTRLSGNKHNDGCS